MYARRSGGVPFSMPSRFVVCWVLRGWFCAAVLVAVPTAPTSLISQVPLPSCWFTVARRLLVALPLCLCALLLAYLVLPFAASSLAGL